MIASGESVVDTAEKPLNAVLRTTASVALAIAGVSVVGMAGVEAWQVFARYVMNNSPSWTEPVALLLMTTAMMFGAAAGVRANRHFGFFIVVEYASPPVQRALRFIARLIIFGIGLMFAIWGGEMLLDAWGYPMAGAPLPQGLVFLPMCLGGVLIALFALEQLISPPPPDRSPSAAMGRSPSAASAGAKERPGAGAQEPPVSPVGE